VKDESENLGRQTPAQGLLCLRNVNKGPIKQG
jgi:hypothetical protein